MATAGMEADTEADTEDTVAEGTAATGAGAGDQSPGTAMQCTLGKLSTQEEGGAE